ncbi:MAG TPA: glycosyltransferase family 9 protein [Actinomycetota bacterium]|nr:glycosyltransferase family 9 protein [Actinomycetota bacterium]
MNRPTVLVLRALGLGDLLTAVPALRAIADAFPSERMALAAAPALRPIVELTGTVDGVIDARPFDPAPIAGLRPRVAIDLHGRGPQSHRMLLASDPDRLIAFHHPEVPASAGAPRWVEEEHEVERWCRLLAESGIPADPHRLDIAPPQPTPVRDGGLTVLHPGAGSAARRWPPARWAEVARAEVRTGRRVVLTGDATEAEVSGEIAVAAGLRRSAVLAGRTDLRQLATVVASAGLVITGDTGTAHLATALGTPSVVLFGPTPPGRWGPPADRPHHVAIWRGTIGDPHGRTVDPGLLGIGVPDVLEATTRARAAGARSPDVVATPHDRKVSA